MAQQDINIGISANDGTGDSLRVAFQKIQDNFTELYDRIAVLDAGVADSIIDLHAETSYSSGDAQRTLTVFKGGFFVLKLRWVVKADISQYSINVFPELQAGIIVNHNLSDFLVADVVGAYSYGTWTFDKFYGDLIPKSSNESQQGDSVGDGWSEDLGNDEPASYYKDGGSSAINLSSSAVNWTWQNSVSAETSGQLRELVMTGHIMNAVQS